MADIPLVTKCNTCKAAFSSVEFVRDHYKTDWHVFNSKRRANNLNHVTLEEYRRQFPAKKSNIAKSSANNLERSSQKVLKQSIPQSPPVVATQSPPRPPAPSVPSAPLPEVENLKLNQANEGNKDLEVTESLKELALQLGVESERVNTVVATALATEGEEKEEDGDEPEEKVPEDDDEPIIIEPNVSIFDDKELPTVDACVQYMERTFGFFIPEREYLTDLSGFLTYLGEKVKIGGICLYCQKQFTPGRPCQNHMMSKSHCKIAYQEGVDEDEFEDFYDFSSSYQGKKRESRGEGEGEGDDDEEDEDDELVDETLEISPIGELILTDGRTVGHRAFRKYYRQKHKPLDNRLSVVAQRREEVHRFQTQFRSTDLMNLAPSHTLNGMDLRRLSDTEVMSLLVKKHRELKRMQQIEQRMQRRQEYRYHRAEYMSVKDQLRARINVTDKIRDYHGMLM